MVGTLSQCIPTSNHHDAHFKYLTNLLVNYASIKLKRKGKKRRKKKQRNKERIGTPPKLWSVCREPWIPRK